MRPDQVKLVATQLGVTEQDVIEMNRRLSGDASLNTPIRDDSDSDEWVDLLVDDSVSQEVGLAESEQSENRHKALGQALTVLNERERRIFEARQLCDEPATLDELADAFGISRERIRQIEVRAFEKVQAAVKHCVGGTQVIRDTTPSSVAAQPPAARSDAHGRAGHSRVSVDRAATDRSRLSSHLHAGQELIDRAHVSRKNQPSRWFDVSPAI
jgi:RNA polymerase sigma-32 factor